MKIKPQLKKEWNRLMLKEHTYNFYFELLIAVMSYLAENYIIATLMFIGALISLHFTNKFKKEIYSK